MNKTITPTNKKTMKSFSSFILTALCCVMALLPTLGAKAVEIVDAEDRKSVV